MVAADLLYEDTHDGATDRQSDDEWEEVDSRKDRVGGEDGLEVKRQVVGSADESEPMAVTDAQGGDVRGLVEKSGWHQRVFRDLPLDEEEEHDCDDSEDDQAECIGTVPWMADATSLQTKKEHNHPSDNGDDTKPVNGLDAGNERRLWCLDLQEKDEQEERSTIKWEVDVNLTRI